MPPVFAAIGTLGGFGVAASSIGGAAAISAGASFAATALMGTLLRQLLVSVAVSALATAMTPTPRAPGIRTSQTLTGGVNPCAFILGTYATAGVAVAPAMSQGSVGKTPNAYLTYVIELGDVPGMALTQLIVDGEAVSLGSTPDPDYGYPILGRFEGYGWIIYYDGSQTTTDSMLLAKYGSYPSRPWTSDMIGRGIPYAILTFRYNRSVFTNLPTVRFVVSGIPLYDPRKDSSVGGSGAHRWGTISSYQPSDNPMVQAYNILRGITLPDGTIWGGDATGEDLPLAEWFTAMNACDLPVSLAAGGTELSYRAGFEVAVSDEPAAVLEELFKAASAQIVDVGGVWKPRVGGPGLPVYVFTDDDILITRPQEYEPFPGLDQTYNGASARYPDPGNLWETTEAPPHYDSSYEAADGNRRLVGSIDLPAVPYPLQVQRLLRAWVEDARRDRRHIINLTPAGAILEPLDAVTWTSDANAYTSKVFEVAECADTLLSALQQVSLRERDSNDYNWSTGFEVPVSTAVGGVIVPDRQAALNFGYPANCFPDFDMVIEDLYATANGAVIALVPTSRVALGQQFLTIKVNAALRSVTTSWFVIEPATEYLVGASVWTRTGATGAGTATVQFETASLDATGTLTSLGSTTVQTITDAAYSGTTSGATIDFVTDPTARRGRFILVRSAGGSQDAGFGGLQVLKKANTGLITSGAVSRTFLKQGSGSTVTISATSFATRQDVISSFTTGIDFVPAASGGGTMLFTLTLKLNKVTAGAAAKLRLTLEYLSGVTWTTYPLDVGTTMDILLPTEFGTETEFRTLFNSDHLALFGGAATPFKLTAYVANSAPFTSAVAIDDCILMLQQLNR